MASDDLVERLRRPGPEVCREAMREAADEIVRLRAAVSAGGEAPRGGHEDFVAALHRSGHFEQVGADAAIDAAAAGGAPEPRWLGKSRNSVGDVWLGSCSACAWTAADRDETSLTLRYGAHDCDDHPRGGSDA